MFENISELNRNRVASVGSFQKWSSVSDDNWVLSFITKKFTRVIKENPIDCLAGDWSIHDVILVAHKDGMFQSVLQIAVNKKEIVYFWCWWVEGKFDACYIPHCETADQAVARCGFMIDYQRSRNGWMKWMTTEEISFTEE
jgi:hypothetical protein